MDRLGEIYWYTDLFRTRHLISFIRQLIHVIRIIIFGSFGLIFPLYLGWPWVIWSLLDYLRGFSSKTILHNYLILKVRTSVLYILDFQVPIRTQKEIKLLTLKFFFTRITGKREGAKVFGKPKRGCTMRANSLATWWGPLLALSVASPHPFYRISVLWKSLCPIPLHIFLRWGRKQKSSSRADPTASRSLPRGNRRCHHHQLSLGVGRSVIIIIKINTTIIIP
jgi:hypothetical protein